MDDHADVFGPYKVEEGEEYRVRMEHYNRYLEFDSLFSEALAAEADLEPGAWELRPDVHFFRMILVQAALSGEATCEDGRQCAGRGRFAASSEVTPNCDDEDIRRMRNRRQLPSYIWTTNAGSRLNRFARWRASRIPNLHGRRGPPA